MEDPKATGYKPNKFKIAGVALSIPVIILLLVGLCTACSAAAFIIQSKINNAAVQPQIRQNLDQNASYRRGVEQQFRAAYQVYQNELNAVTLDQQNLTNFVKLNGNPSTYAPISSQSNEYQQLFTLWTDDRQGLVNSVTAYNALCANADTGPYRPSDLPASLAVPTPSP